MVLNEAFLPTVRMLRNRAQGDTHRHLSPEGPGAQARRRWDSNLRGPPGHSLTGISASKQGRWPGVGGAGRRPLPRSAARSGPAPPPRWAERRAARLRPSQAPPPRLPAAPPLSHWPKRRPASPPNGRRRGSAARALTGQRPAEWRGTGQWGEAAR